ncbi:alpha/beta fold hydrolase [Novosphingobium sp. Gsoil 351]|uniref:alpha/beta fold hydrolase n=1 Tax=Novosphingobium sp. Gsoil 351 TaxID=2675225 RepID=UPI0012B4E4F5|nr:alpha/beta fold hydrolase [Novosphingobium sp. Gsoil 351]QGN53974.1 alpha/beta fold hydrolase [Novosphingobium sp. Gsoil 351]
MIRKGYAESSGGQIHYRRSKGSGTPLVFFHQTASSSQMWLKVMAALGDWGRDLIALDTPGFGGSFDPDPDSRPQMSDYARWLREALADLGIERAHLVGHHTGACIAVDMAGSEAALAATMTLLGPVPLTAEERDEFSKHFGIPFTPGVSGAYLLENWEYLRNLGAHADPMLIHREMADQLRAWWGRVQSYGAVWTQDFKGIYECLEMPLMIGAAPEDVLYPFLDRAAELQPSARVLQLTGHNFEPDLDASTIADALRQFCRE